MGPTLVYDGDCAFCLRCARWVQRRATGLDVVPWQRLDLAEAGLTEEQLRTAAYWVDGVTAVAGERAIAHALLACGRGYAAIGRVLLLPGVRTLAGVGYRFVARHRGRLGRMIS